MLRKRDSYLALCAFAIMALAGGCGGGEDPESMGAVSRCGPNGRWHTGLGAEGHCDCDDGYHAVSNFCVENQVATQPPPSGAPNCGPNGSYDGRRCMCDAGYTQTGLEETRTCTAIPLCQSADDSHEPNDTPQDATELAHVSGTLYACPADSDWFVFPVKAGDQVSAVLSFNGGTVDLDLFMFGPSSQMARAVSLGTTSDSEVGSFVARADGTAGILVAPYGIGEGEYQLAVRVEDGDAPMCGGPAAACSGSGDCCSGICHQGHCH